MSVEKFLRQRAVNVVVGGQYTLSNWLDAQGRPRSFACRTSRVSPFRMIVDVPVVGQLEGCITDTVSGSFLLELTMTPPMRQKLSDKLTWLEKYQKDPTVREERKQARIIPASPHSMLTFADGTMKNCFVIDMSVSGAAVSADVQPEIGTPLAIGACVGRVVRHLDGGFAVKFIEQQHREQLERRVIRAPSAPPPRATAFAAQMDAQMDSVDEDMS
jgi:hypothetical protein